ncbi:TetR family transcriptional regulator [Stakelama pacifica]|uniref:TetR family transcriptional regulator n=2 Tax=Stakelama pacifica TaxID=517720 RepID=A0A4R6FDE6_9SPHN|nr:TetR family transcriptional regulator [Stakelama pacifica]GGO98621.1 hypothetical protein GCM10011329_30230 [Stakelama pacifica]
MGRMTDTDAILSAAEKLLDRNGFSATSIDRLTDAAGVSSRTFYKHVGSRQALIAAILDARAKRFLAAMPRTGTDALFAALGDWFETQGANGCFFLRAAREIGEGDARAQTRLTAQKQQTLDLIGDCVASDLGRRDDALAGQILILFEGATHAAVYRGRAAVADARAAAATLLAAAHIRSGAAYA